VEKTLEEKLNESNVSFEKKEQNPHGTITKISGIMKKSENGLTDIIIKK
jgi:hypothetical protein